jgi:predicted nucleic acid-binding protein
LDTSVFGGCFEEEFEEHSRLLFDQAINGRLTILLSEVVLRELAEAPDRVKKVFEDLPPSATETVKIDESVLELRDAYIGYKVVGPGSIEDATHVAAATIARADAVVSWNFKHIVRLEKIIWYNRVNALKGYGALTILSPREVDLRDDRED